MENKFKTIHENKVLINPSIIENNKITMVEVLNNLKSYISSLPKYRNEWGYVVENDNGEYIKLEDVLKLFGAENDI